MQCHIIKNTLLHTAFPTILPAGMCNVLDLKLPCKRGLNYFIYPGRESVLTQYVTTMYWAAATTCSVGYGDIHAYVTEEASWEFLKFAFLKEM